MALQHQDDWLVGMKLCKGIELLNEQVGSGAEAIDGARVLFNARFFLRRGEEVLPCPVAAGESGFPTAHRFVDGAELVDFETVLGSRQVIAGVERALRGMRVDGYREVLVAPHLAYGLTGLADRIPPSAMLRIQLWLRRVYPPHHRHHEGAKRPW